MLVTVERDGAVAIVTLNRPEAMNALSRGLRAQLAQVMTELDAEDRIRAVVLTGAGTRAFTAGLDLKELGVEGLGAAGEVVPFQPLYAPAAWQGSRPEGARYALRREPRALSPPGSILRNWASRASAPPMPARRRPTRSRRSSSAASR